jgi:hypothetical protein
VRVQFERSRPSVDAPQIGSFAPMPSSIRPNAVSRCLAAAAVTGCVLGDPGWIYEATGGVPVQESGLRYDVKGSSGLLVRVHASAFTGSLTAEVDVVGSNVSLPSDAHLALSLIDRSGRPLPHYRGLPPSSGCRSGGRAGSGFAPTSLVCFAREAFEIRPISGCSRNPELDQVTLVIAGMGDGFPSEVRVPMRAK